MHYGDMKARYAWDADKAAKNLQSHGVSFEEAVEVFSDPSQVVSENYYIMDQGEQRYQIIGMTRRLLLLLVVFVDRSISGFETIHIVSARKADKYEERAYTD